MPSDKETPDQDQRPSPNDLIIERRSIDPQTVFDGMQAFGAATGGVGALLLGAAKVKEAFGEEQDAGGEQPPPSGENPPPAKSD